MKNKYDTIVMYFAVIIIIAIAALYFYRETKLNQDGIFIVARITKIKDFENGYWATIAYHFNSKEYKFHCNMLPKIKDSLVFVNISKQHPWLSKLVRNEKVPSCLTYGFIAGHNLDDLSCP